MARFCCISPITLLKLVTIIGTAGLMLVIFGIFISKSSTFPVSFVESDMRAEQHLQSIEEYTDESSTCSASNFELNKVIRIRRSVDRNDLSSEELKIRKEFVILEKQYKRCKRNADPENCRYIQDRIKLVYEKFHELEKELKMLQEIEGNKSANVELSSNHSVIDKPGKGIISHIYTGPDATDRFIDDHFESKKFNKDQSKQMKDTNQNLELISTKFHEDLFNDHPTKQWQLDEMDTVEKFWREKTMPIHRHNSRTEPLQRNKEHEPKIPPSKIESIGPSGPFMTLCEQMARQNSPNHNGQNIGPPPVNPHPTHPTNFAYNGPPFYPNHQFTGRGQINIPVTGESMSSGQVVSNHAFNNFLSAPICFYAQPNIQFRSQMQPNLIFANPTGIFVPTNGVTSNIYGHTSLANNVNQNLQGRNIVQSQPLYCSYVPIMNNALNTIGTGHFRTTETSGHNIPSDTDTIFGTYPNQIMPFTNRSAGSSNRCGPGMVSCFATPQCIAISKWCDSTVDCIDSSDETSCSCKARLVAEKICDGYIDCPMGSDEIGCFNCDRFSYSCYSNLAEFNDANQSILSMCYTMTEKCDGFENCLNGKDETGCSLIANDLGQLTSYMVSYTEGFLHRNHKGKWYPVCENPLHWAREACEAENGPIDSDPIISYKSIAFPGQFIQPKDGSPSLFDPAAVRFTDTCTPNSNNQQNSIVSVKCPPPKCGRRITEFKSPLRIKNRTNDKSTKDKRQLLRIVGGVEAEPLKWPYIIGIYRDGRFHCGGIIHNEFWIITAAHCVDKYPSHYYEVRAGMIRRTSFSPMVQIVTVAGIAAHENYDRSSMINDLALCKLTNPLNFNRWVKPICMPDIGRTSIDPADWIWGPEQGSVCTTIGWGAVQERGPDPDQLQEVNVPILGRCKHLPDRQGEEICAGAPEGGRDACQGDSGGPLFCQSVSDRSEYYLAGVVSHGEGCARPDEPGVYTRVALFLDWIKMRENNLLAVKPLQECPGFRCVWGGGFCIHSKRRCDGIVDCLGGEDEVTCPFQSGGGNFLSSVKMENGSQPTVDLRNKIDPKGIDRDTKELTTENSVHLINDVPKIPVKETIDPSDHFESIPQPNTDGKRFKKKEISLTGLDTTSVTNSSSSTFTCKRILQKINKIHKCDRITDCEDGTDEEGCTCRDYLEINHKELICDGKMDCTDLSDENNCLNCTTDEFACSFSKQCISQTLLCNQNFDCEFKEDELDCFSLTNGQYIELDAHQRPALHPNGIVMKNVNGNWSVLCAEEINVIETGAETAGQICSILGFSGYKFFNLTDIPTLNDKQLITAIDAENEIDNQLNHQDYVKIFMRDMKCKDGGLYVECLEFPLHNFTVSIDSKPINQSEIIQPILPVISPNDKPTVIAKEKNNGITSIKLQEHWPWIAYIYIDGRINCIGLIVDRFWILSESSLLSKFNLMQNHIAVLVGGSKSKTHPNLEEPFEQAVQVDCIHKVDDSNIVILHLEHPLDYNRQCLPVGLPTINGTTVESECLAINRDGNGRLQYVSISHVNKGCSHGRRCYSSGKINKNSNCNSEDTSPDGVIMCRTQTSGWFPSALFVHRLGICAFEKMYSATPLNKFSKDIQKVIEISTCDFVPELKKCDGHLCKIGKCISKVNVCNGNFDCPDGSDEMEDICRFHNKVCSVSDIKCRNGKCVAKEKFCDHNNDCGDLTDEPFECSCLTYLQATHPEKICDGIRNCLDKSDERYCECTANPNMFRCGSSKICVPKDFLCDGTRDCDLGEDEFYCYGLEYPSVNNQGFAQVIQQSFGVWHTKCFPKSDIISIDDEIKQICKNLGYPNSQSRSSRIIDDSPISNNSKSVYQNPPTKAVLANAFFPTSIHSKFTILLKPSRPIADVAKWDHSDIENCYRIEIKCE